MLKAMSILNLMKLDTETTHDDSDHEEPAPAAEDAVVELAEDTDDGKDDADFIEHAVIVSDGDILIDVDSDDVLTPRRARLFGERLIQLADEIDPGASSLIDLLDEAEKRSMGLVNDLMQRDAKIAELQVQLNEAILDAQRTTLRASSLEGRLADLKETPIWEVSFTGQRVFIAARSMELALARFKEYKPNATPTAIRTAGVTLVI